MDSQAKMFDDRLPPSDEEAEELLLAALFNTPSLFDEIDQSSLVNDFSTTANSVLFSTMAEMWGNGIKPDMGSLLSTLRSTNKVDVIGGPGRIVLLMESAILAYDWQFSLNIVKEKALARRIIKAGTEISKLGFDQSVKAQERLDKAQQIVYDLNESDEGVNHAIPSVDACDIVIERLYSGKQGNIIGHGFGQLYAVTGGIRPGHLHVAIGETSMGKSHFGVAMAVSYAPIVPVMVVTVEMDVDEYMSRILARYSGVDSRKISTNELNDDELAKVVESTNMVSQLKMHIFAAGNPSATHIKSEIRRMTRYWKEPPKLLIIDYLQYMNLPGTKSMNRVQELDSITKEFKAISTEFNLCTLLLSQARREVMDRHDRRPKKNDSRECGAIENHANLILGLYRDEVARPDADDVESGNIEILVLKNRGGNVNRTIKMDFDPTTSYFS
jgi:replicative DNA helicase